MEFFDLGGLVSVKAPNRAQFEAFVTANAYMNFRDTRARRDHLARFYNRILAYSRAHATQIEAMRLNLNLNCYDTNLFLKLIIILMQRTFLITNQ